jgi:signal transduction histidine kinase
MSVTTSLTTSLKKSINPLFPKSWIRYPTLNRLSRLLEVAGTTLGVAESGSELEELRTAHKDFVESVSHELRTPLTSLRLSVQMLQGMAHAGRLSELPADRLNQVLCTADRQIDRLKALMDVFLEASTMKAEYLDLRPEAMDIQEAVQVELARFRSDPRLARVEIRQRSSGLTQGVWDRGRIGQVVRNMLLNAATYGREKPIELRIAGDAHEVSLSVSDLGIGIARADQARIFEPFERAVPGTHYNGMGLGLYVAREIAIAHRGALKVRSKLGAGSTFTLCLPVDPAQVSAQVA